jgi:hypothetical protein
MAVFTSAIDLIVNGQVLGRLSDASLALGGLLEHGGVSAAKEEDPGVVLCVAEWAVHSCPFSL